ncbi:hypothetical protein GJ744_003913 [Endocarpon pusillum]|uniref:Ubiquitin 3 binding protein But2 C-terminal domain-containing protein n=1 Tax=Endocarpon pusillum TaxID=364733 RepID=A0A8H7AA60_9EURO|nr:hypothetical protein GJ744_003913 [Endocarpon pusillum]
MQFTTSLFLALIGSYVSAAPAPSCSVLDIFFTSLVNDFTLSVLIPSQGRPGTQDSWALLLDPRDPSETVTSVPIISRTRIAQPTFRLVNQTLVTAEGGFPAIGSPGITIFPPPLQGWEHGGPGETPLSFGAVYACDATGQQYIKLVADSGFALSSVAEGQRVFIKPQAFEGQAVDVTLRVDGGQG